jgi:putative membrane protein
VEQLFGLDVWGQLDNSTLAASILGLLVLFLALPLLLFVSFFITLIRTVLRYYNLKFWRDGKSYKVVSGLLTRNEKSIQKSKIQIIRWVTSPLKRMFGMFQMNIYQATSFSQGRDKSLIIPGCYSKQVQHTLDTIVPEYRDAEFSSHSMHPAIVILMVCVFGLLPSVGFGILAWYTESIVQWLLVLIFPMAIWMGILYQRKRKLKIHPDFLVSEGGIFGNTYQLIEIYKIQGVTIHSSPMQRRRGVTSLHIYTAGGDISFPYINAEVARQARDYILYRVEVEKKSWM